MKIISWNVNGIRAIAKKNFFSDLKLLGADILCFQETKASEDQVAETLKPLNGYYILFKFCREARLFGNSRCHPNQAPECDKRN